MMATDSSSFSMAFLLETNAGSTGVRGCAAMPADVNSRERLIVMVRIRVYCL